MLFVTQLKFMATLLRVIALWSLFLCDCSMFQEALKIWPHVHELNELRLQRLEETHKVQQEVENKMVEYIKFLDDTKADSDTKDNENLPSYRKQIQQLAFDVKSMYDKVRMMQTLNSRSSCAPSTLYHLELLRHAAIINRLRPFLGDRRYGRIILVF